MPDIKGKRSPVSGIIPSGDYKSSDPTPVVLAKGAAEGLVVTLTPSALSGAGCTVTCTVTDADTNAVLGTLVVNTNASKQLILDTVPYTTHRIKLTCVGSGTRTTLTYSVDAEWRHLTYTKDVYWDGTAYVTNTEKTVA